MRLRKFKDAFCWVKYMKYTFILLLYMPVFLFAQMKTISGTVKSDDGKPLPGASVKLKNAKAGTVTDENGKFSINAPEGAVFVISSVGYTDQEVMIDAKILYNVALQPSSNNGTADVTVVSIGYGSVKRKDLTGSISTAPIKDMNKAPVGDVMQSMQGRMAGVVLASNDGTPGAAPNILIRGGNSITGDNTPLYVVDGIIVENTPSAGGIAQNLLGINPSDIESMEVLKDASATAIYGARGANGVIIITTKKGKSGAPILNVNAYVGFQKDSKFLKMMGPYDYVLYMRERDSLNNNYIVSPGGPLAVNSPIFGAGYATDKVYGDSIGEITNPAWPAGSYYIKYGNLSKYKSVAPFDFQRSLFGRTAPMQNVDMSVSGGTDKTRYFMSGNLFNQDGIMLASGYRRYQGRMSMDHTFSQKLKAGATINYSYIKQWGGTPLPSTSGSLSNNSASGTANGSAAYYSTVFSALAYRPVTPLDKNGKPSNNLYDASVDSSVYQSGNAATSSAINPVLNQQHSLRNIFNKNISASVYMEYKFVPQLTLRIYGGISSNTARNEQYYDTLTQQGFRGTSVNNGTPNAQGSIAFAEYDTWTNTNQLTYDNVFSGGHHLNVVGVIEERGVKQYGYGYSANNINPALGFAVLGQGTITSTASTSTSNRTASFLGRVNYDFKSRYYLTGSFRADGSSRFASQNRWGYFPSGAFKWRFIDEPFIKGNKIFSDGNLRVSYGVTGNNNVGDFNYLTAINIATTGNGTYTSPNGTNWPAIQTGAYQGISNVGLKWESTAQTDIGTDLAFLNNRITLTADVYRKKTTNLLLNTSLPSSTGFTSINANVGSTQNQGLELAIATINIQSTKPGGFSWSSSFNIAWNSNKVVSVQNGQETLPTSLTTPNFAGVVGYIGKVGQPLGLMYGYVSDGLYQYKDFNYTTALSGGTNYVGIGSHYVLKDNVPYYGSIKANIQPGDLKFKDINGDGKIDANDMTVIGRGQPIHTGGFNNNFSYKGFTLNIFFQWSYGNNLYNTNSYLLNGGWGSTTNQLADYVNRWEPNNQNTNIPRLGGGVVPAANGIVYSSRMVEDGSYLRLKTVNLTYNFPAGFLKRTGIKNCTVYVSGQNLLTWTKYTGQDPEVNSLNSVIMPGFDYSVYPHTRTYVIGANLSF